MMSEEPQYTQIKRPVSRVAEKVLGWLNWIGLLLLIVITMFIALVSFSNNTSIQNLEQSINNNDLAQQVLANNSLNTTQFVIWLQNGIWAVIVYLIVCLLISFLALISMNIRVLSGILFLVASIITLPLVLLLATIVIPVLFFIVAIMMFARKDRIETVPRYGGGYVPYEGGYDDYDRYDREPVRRPHGYPEDERTPRYEPSYEKRDEYDDEEDDVKPYVPKKDRVQETHQTEDTEEPVQSEEPITRREDESEPEFLSRQAKYKQKSEEEVREQQEQDAYEREQARMQEPSNEPEEVKYRDVEPRKGETAEEKAARKREKKERKRRAKEARKNRPSAVNQRRMNFEERRSFNQGKSPTTQETKEDDVQSTEDTQAQDSDKKS
ncbi:MAG: lipoteichoic acid stability factor AuxB [Staphylococcus simulans]